MNSDKLIKWTENKYNRLLILLFWLFVSIALPEGQVTVKRLILILFLISMLSVIRQIRPGRWWLKFYTTLVLINLLLLGLQMLGVLNIFVRGHGLSAIEFTLFIVISVPILPIQQEFFQTQEVTADTIKGAIAIYILMGIAWSAVYNVLFDFDPTSFYGINPSQYQADFLHLSFVTLTTVGYGNIFPMVSFARIATDLEAIAGVMYPSILVARLVGLYGSHPKESL